jgi:hypothetical protein
MEESNSAMSVADGLRRRFDMSIVLPWETQL